MSGDFETNLFHAVVEQFATGTPKHVAAYAASLHRRINRKPVDTTDVAFASNSQGSYCDVVNFDPDALPGREAPQKLDKRAVYFGGTFLLGPVTAARQDERTMELWQRPPEGRDRRGTPYRRAIAITPDE